MSKDEFICQLRAELAQLPIDEQESAVQYYIDYFDDAGVENVQNVIEHLGTPKRIAAIIIAEYKGVQNGGAQPQQQKTQNRNTNKALWMIIIILGFPLWMPLLLAGFGVVFGVFFAGVAILFSLAIIAVCLVLAGAVMFGAGIVAVVATPLGALLAIGGGLCFVGIGVIGTVFMVWVCIQVMPALFRLLVKVCRLPFYGREGK